MKDASDFFEGFALFILAVIGICMLIGVRTSLVYSDYYSYFKSNSEVCEGTIVECDAVTVGTHTEYSVVYEYYVDGEKYMNRSVFLDELFVGEPVKLFYNGESPEKVIADGEMYDLNKFEGRK